MSSQMDPRVIKHGKTSNLLLDKNTTCPPRFVGFYHGKACQKKTALLKATDLILYDEMLKLFASPKVLQNQGPPT